MDAAVFNKIIEEQLALCSRILVRKASEYAPGNDRLYNFKEAAALQNITQAQALAGMMAKHVVSIFDMIHQAEDFSMERWDEKLTDNINYLLLLKAVVTEEKWQKPVPEIPKPAKHVEEPLVPMPKTFKPIVPVQKSTKPEEESHELPVSNGGEKTQYSIVYGAATFIWRCDDCLAMSPIYDKNLYGSPESRLWMTVHKCTPKR